MKNLNSILILLVLISLSCKNINTEKKDVENTFKDIQLATKQNEDLWKTDIYGPILFVNQESRLVYANFQDKSGVLKKDGNIFIGYLPKEINISNTSIQWGGINWAMIMLPLPADRFERLNLCTHELFHRSQTKLGFEASNPENNHLDQKDGRIYLRLELEALKQAIEANSQDELKKQLTNALTFRKYRYHHFPSAELSENELELNEGIAEYTGVMMSERSSDDMKSHFIKSIDNFFNVPTFVRSFAYQTVPVYGYLVYKTKKDWNIDIKSNSNLTDYFIKQFQITIPTDLKSAIQNLRTRYCIAKIAEEETVREEKNQKIIAEFKNRFINNPHFEIHFEQMNISFNPGNIIPLDNYGTVYPTLRVSDKWGILTVTNGALLGANWDKVTLSNPTKIGKEKIMGDGWTLEMNTGYSIEKNNNGNYYLKKD